MAVLAAALFCFASTDAFARYRASSSDLLSSRAGYVLNEPVGHFLIAIESSHNIEIGIYPVHVWQICLLWWNAQGNKELQWRIGGSFFFFEERQWRSYLSCGF